MPNKIMKPLARRGDREVPMEYAKKKKKPVLAVVAPVARMKKGGKVKKGSKCAVRNA